MRLDDGSPVSREAHAGFCESRGVRFPPATHLVVLCPTKERAEAALAALTEILAGLGLSLAEANTHVVDLREPKAGFDFLGHADLGVMPTSSESPYSLGINGLKLSA